jgi:hypothetical protein
MLDFIQFKGDYALTNTVAPDIATGMPLGGSRVRSRYGVTVVGIQRPGQDFSHATAETVIEKADVIIVTGKIHAVETFAAASWDVHRHRGQNPPPSISRAGPTPMAWVGRTPAGGGGGSANGEDATRGCVRSTQAQIRITVESRPLGFSIVTHR